MFRIRPMSHNSSSFSEDFRDVPTKHIELFED
jgi:hypothetical protein